MTSPAGLYTCNYYPTPSNFMRLWENYSGTQTSTDMGLIAALGFNTVRLFIPAVGAGDPDAIQGTVSNGAFNWPTPTSGQLASLTDFCTRSVTAGLKVHLTLFDHFGPNNAAHDYGLVAASQTWATAIMSAVTSSQLACVELQNETYWSDTSAFTGAFDSGWPSGAPTTNVTQGQAATIWGQVMIPYLRGLTTVPVVVSATNDSVGSANPLRSAVSGLTGSALPDWFEWHCYPDATSNGPGPVSLPDVYTSLITAKGIVAPTGKPLYIGEMGAAGYPHADGTIPAAQATQAQVIQTIRWACQHLGLPEPGVWELYDTTPYNAYTVQGAYGLYDNTGNLKPSGHAYVSVPPGTTIPQPFPARFYTSSSGRLRAL